MSMCGLNHPVVSEFVFKVFIEAALVGGGTVVPHGMEEREREREGQNVT